MPAISSKDSINPGGRRSGHRGEGGAGMGAGIALQAPQHSAQAVFVIDCHILSIAGKPELAP